MPELPDVENFKRYFNCHARNRAVAHTEVHGRRVLGGTSAQTLKRALTKHKLTRSRRHGKHLFARLARGRWLALHFGRTGYLSSFKDLNDDPKHDLLRLDFSRGGHFAFVDPRRFGRIQLIGEPDDLIADNELGPDALHKTVSQKKLRDLLAGRRGDIKAALMDQSLLAGIGNVYSDEILFQSRLHPKMNVERLDNRTIASLLASCGGS